MILKAIHNHGVYNRGVMTVASHHANLWFWKQFTTKLDSDLGLQLLRVITQTYDFESNSQLN